MDAAQLLLITLVTKRLKEKGYRYLAEEEEDGTLVIRIWKGLDRS